MLDRSIAFYNTILRCDHYQPQDVILPDGFSIVPYENGYEKAWAKLEHAVGDFGSPEEAEEYFAAAYMQDRDLLLQNVRFLLREDRTVIGSCIAWQDRRQDAFVSSLHWLVVDEQYQSMGLGKALCRDVMNIFAARGGLPVYIHTQPWSWKAIFLYLSLGFRLQQTDTFSDYANEYHQAIRTLKSVVTDEQFRRLTELSEP